MKKLLKEGSSGFNFFDESVYFVWTTHCVFSLSHITRFVLVTVTTNITSCYIKQQIFHFKCACCPNWFTFCRL